MKIKRLKPVLTLILCTLTSLGFSQRLVRVVNNTNCNFEVTQFEYEVTDHNTGITNVYWYPDQIHGYGLFAHGVYNLPSNTSLLTRWQLDQSHEYDITIKSVWIYDIYGLIKTNFLPVPGATIIGEINTQCCESGQFTSSRHLVNPPSQDFELIISCLTGPGQ